MTVMQAAPRSQRTSLDAFLSLVSGSLLQEEVPEEQRSVITFATLGRGNDTDNENDCDNHNHRGHHDHGSDKNLKQIDQPHDKKKMKKKLPGFNQLEQETTNKKKKKSERHKLSHKEHRNGRTSRLLQLQDAPISTNHPGITTSTTSMNISNTSSGTTKSLGSNQTLMKESTIQTLDRPSTTSSPSVPLHTLPATTTQFREEIMAQTATCTKVSTFASTSLGDHRTKAAITNPEEGQCVKQLNGTLTLQKEPSIPRKHSSKKYLKASANQPTLSDHTSLSIKSLSTITGGLNDESSITPSMADNTKMMARKEQEKQRKQQQQHQVPPANNNQEHSLHMTKDNHNRSMHQGNNQNFSTGSVPLNQLKNEAPKALSARASLSDHLSNSIRSLTAMGGALNDESSITPSLADNSKMMASKDQDKRKKRRQWRKSQIKNTHDAIEVHPQITPPEPVDVATTKVCVKSIAKQSSTLSASSHVSFSTVKFREYNLVVGDNPSCSDCLPVSLGWDHGPEVSISIDDFENDRELFKQKPDTTGNDNRCQQLKWHERRELLIGVFGYTEQELRKQEKAFAEANGRARKSRLRITKDWFLRSKGRGQPFVPTKKQPSLVVD